MTDRTTALRALERAVPKFACKSGCNDCCGLVPFLGPEKYRVSQIRPMEQWEPFQNGAWVLASALATFSCPFSSQSGCQIYDDRPIVCRLFGAVDAEMMTCPHGCEPSRKISDAQARAIIAQEGGE